MTQRKKKLESPSHSGGDGSNLKYVNVVGEAPPRGNNVRPARISKVRLLHTVGSRHNTQARLGSICGKRPREDAILERRGKQGCEATESVKFPDIRPPQDKLPFARLLHEDKHRAENGERRAAW